MLPRSYSPAVVFCLVLAAHHQLAFGGQDHEAWFYAAAQTPVGTDWSAAAVGALRYSNALDGLSDRFVEVRLTRKLPSSWQLTPSLRVNHAQTRSGLSRREIQSALAVGWRGVVSNWQVRFRGRIEYRDFDNITRDGWRFRLRLRADPPMPEGSVWQPYFSNETFHDRGDSFIDENRFFAGGLIRLSKLWTANVFAGWRHRSNASVLANSIIGGIGMEARF